MLAAGMEINKIPERKEKSKRVNLIYPIFFYIPFLNWESSAKNTQYKCFSVRMNECTSVQVNEQCKSVRVYRCTNSYDPFGSPLRARERQNTKNVRTKKTHFQRASRGKR